MALLQILFIQILNDYQLCLQSDLMSLIGKKILVIGGNGYVGNYFASRLVKQSATVSAMSRKGIKYNFPQNSQIDWLVSDVSSPGKYVQNIKSADIIIHTIGTLIDSSVLKGTPPGGPGTYQQVNRDTFRALLGYLETPKKVIYLSSNAHPPFLSRYLTTKHQAQQSLFATNHEGYSLRPGFIHDSKHRVWSSPLNYAIKGWNKVFPYVFKIAPPQTCLQKSLAQFKQGDTTPLSELGDAVVELCINGSNKKILQNEDIHSLSIKLNESHKNKQ